MTRHVSFFVVMASIASVVLVACAKPTPSMLPDASGTSFGPSNDLAGFITATPDMAQAVIVDMAVTPPSDGSTPPADMATPPTGACGSITYAGICTGNVLKYCLSNQLTTLDCGAKSMACKVDATGDADCHYVAGNPCGTLDAAGVCDGNTLAYCSSNKVVLQNCTSSGTTCDDTFGFADCF